MALNHSINSSARAISDSGTARPNDFSTRAINSLRFMSSMGTASPMRYERRRRARGSVFLTSCEHALPARGIAAATQSVERLLALDQAKKTGNYTVLRDLGAPDFPKQ
jgi:hypothetical protein